MLVLVLLVVVLGISFVIGINVVEDLGICMKMVNYVL